MSLMQNEKAKKFAGITQNLNRFLSKSLQSFQYNQQWTDINNWLTQLQNALKDLPSPFIAEKVLLSKRLNQCMNPILPEKIHECVLRIHQILFTNMRNSVQGNINDYIRLFSQDLGVYSVSILPYFTHTNVLDHRIMVLKIINKYYLDLGKELIPMLPGLLKSLLPVLAQTINAHLIALIQGTLTNILEVAGRRYVIGITWSMILKFRDCKEGGIKFLSKVIEKMQYIKGEEEFEEERGFSDIQRQIDAQEMVQNGSDPLIPNVVQPQIIKRTSSHQKLLKKIQDQNPNTQSPKAPQPQTPIQQLQTPAPVSPGVSAQHPQTSEFDGDFFDEPKNQQSNQQLKPTQPTQPTQTLELPNIKQQDLQESINDHKSKKDPPAADQKIQSIKQEQEKKEQGEQEQMKKLFQSQSPSYQKLFKNQQQISLDKVPLIITPGIASIKESIDLNIPQNNFPHPNTLIVSSLISCLEEDSPLIKRTALDFLFSHLRIKNEIFTENDRMVLVQGLIRLFKKKEISISKRVNRWIFGKADEEGRWAVNQKNKFVVTYIIKGFQKILETVPTNQENCSLPLKILQNFYIQHPNLVELTLKQISVNVLRYIFNFGTALQSTKPPQYTQQILKVGKRFLENLPSYYTIIFESLGCAFIEGVKTNNDHKSFQAIKYIDFCYINLMKHEHGLQQLEYITVTLEYVCKGLSMLVDRQALYSIFMKDAVVLVCNLVIRREGVQKYNRKEQEKVNLKYFQETGEHQLPPERIKYQQEQLQAEKVQQNRYVGILADLQRYFTKLGYIIKTQANIQLYEESFKHCANAITRLQLHLPRVPITTLPKWFMTIEGGIKVTNPIVSLAAIEAMIKCLMWEDKHPIYASFKNIILQQKSNKVGTDYQKLALQKLWSLLDYPHMHAKIIDLIVAFSMYFPYEFTQTVKRSFATHSAPQKQASIQRFSHFWRLTGFKYKDLLTTNKQFVELNKVGLFRMLDFLDDQNPLVRHAAKNWLMQSMGTLTRVIEPLLHQLLLSCTEWYQTPKGIFLIQKAYDTDMIFSTFRRIRSILSNGSYTFLRYVYQTEISQTLDQLREKITSLTGRLLTTEDQPIVITKEEAKVAFDREPVLPKALQLQQQKEVKVTRMSYLDLLIILAVKYTEGHAIQSMGVDFYIGNSGVNASAVQLIQTLLDYIDSPILGQKLINYIKQYLFKVLSQSVLNQQYIMQIQLLNLIRNIFFNSSFRKKGQKQRIRGFFKAVFTDKVFITSALNGLHTPFAYVRSQFISFITVCIPLIADFLDPAECTECIRHILFTYYKIIKDIGITLSKSALDDEREELEEERREQADSMSMSKIIELEIRMKIQQKFVKFSDNLNQVGKTNEILSVLHGVEAILNYFYDLDKVNVKDLGFQFTNPYSFFDTFKKIVTFGLASSQKNATLVEHRNFLHNYQTCQALLKDLQPVYQTILRSWPLSQQFVRIGSQEFSSVGMRTFNFQRFNKYNKLVKDLIEYVQTQKESIWGKIFTIMQPMFCKFPKQIIDIYLKIWIRQCSDIKSQVGKINPQYERTELLMKIMQTIIVNNFPMNVVIHAFLESTPLQQLSTYYTQKSANNKGNILDYNMNKNQAKLLYFLYVYFNYVYLNQKELTRQPLLQIWGLIMKSLKPFERSRSPMVSIWIIELLNLCSRKYSPKELLINQRFKSDLHLLINTNLKYLATIAARKEIFFYSQPPTKINFAEEQAKKDQYHVVLPLPPTLYEVFKMSKKNRNNSDNLCFKEYRAGQNSQIQKRYRMYCFKILKKLGLQILQNTYLPQKTHWVVIRTVEWIDILLPVIQDKAQPNMIYAQSASQIVYDILDKARILFIKDLKPKVLAIFNKDDFFICNAATLNYWAKIIDWIVSMDKANQTYLQYLNKVSLSSSYFTSQNVQNKKRIKSFQRICFILYSGSKDKYANKIKGLIEKIADVIKKPESVHPALHILILFSIRILILRLSQISLNQLFIDIWPMILTLLMQMFSRQMVKVAISNQISRNPNLLLAALKLVEMISLTNLGQFAHHQWVFICDYFGVSLTVPQITSEMIQIFTRRPQLAGIIITDNRSQSTPFIYRPFLLNYLPPSSINYISVHDKQENVSFKPLKRKIIVKDSFIRDQSQLRLNVLLLMQYLQKVSEYRMEVDWNEIEQVIVNDFINLDSFIHQIS